MPTLENIPPLSDTTLSHPILSVSEPTPSAEKLKILLLSLSRDPDNAAYRSILRSAADAIRETAFGYNRSVTKRKVLKLLSEYDCLELSDLTDETGIAEKEIREAIEEMIADGSVMRGRRRRWQEPGKHYNDIFFLKAGT